MRKLELDACLQSARRSGGLLDDLSAPPSCAEPFTRLRETRSAGEELALRSGNLVFPF